MAGEASKSRLYVGLQIWPLLSRAEELLCTIDVSRAVGGKEKARDVAALSRCCTNARRNSKGECGCRDWS